jgi:flagellar basal-body rod protein FlgC
MIPLTTTAPGQIPGVRAAGPQKETSPLVKAAEKDMPNLRKNVVFDPSHPDADADGYVVYPDVNIVEEMVDLMVSSRAFDADVTVINAAKSMITKSLEI